MKKNLAPVPGMRMGQNPNRVLEPHPISGASLLGLGFMLALLATSAFAQEDPTLSIDKDAPPVKCSEVNSLSIDKDCLPDVAPQSGEAEHTTKTEVVPVVVPVAVPHVHPHPQWHKKKD